LGYAYCCIGLQEKALEYCLQGLSISRDIGDYYGESSALSNIALIYNQCGDYALSIQHYKQSLKISQKLKILRIESMTLCRFAITLIKIGSYSESLEKLQQAELISLQIGSRNIQAEALKALADLHKVLGQPDIALQYCKDALLIAEKLNIPLAKECKILLHEIEYIC